MTIRILTVLFTVAVVMVGCAGNPSLDSLKAGTGGALVGIDIARLDDAPAPKKLQTLDMPTVDPGIGKYDFTLEEVDFREKSFLANGSQAPSVKIIGKNRGYAPVSVTIVYDLTLSENMTCEGNRPQTAVVPPLSEMVVARFDPIIGHSRWKLAWSRDWSIGDYTAQHACREGYRLPFPDKVPAYASAPEQAASNPYAGNAVIFSLPADTTVLAARKGTVVRIDKNNNVDILHDDSTIATYSHLGELARGIRVGKFVKVGQPVGSAGKTAEGAYMQLAVWRPEPKETDAFLNNGKSVFQTVSYPLEFCDDSGKCRELKRSQPISPTAPPVTANKSAAKAKTGEYDFSIMDDHSAGSSFMSDSPAAARIVAVNHGYAPVSVTLDFDPDVTENFKSDVTLPLAAVVLPQSELVLARLTPIDAHKGMKYSFKNVWQLGDFKTRHQCPEHYRFPFAANVRAFAAIPAPREPDSYTRYSVQFSMPAGSKVLAARNGIVVRVKKNNGIDVLHNDSTIATYDHLGKVDKGIYAGKRVSAGDVLGLAGKSEKPGEAYFHIAVWRPEQISTDKSVKKGATPTFQAVSFPLEFCSDMQDCKVLTHNQPVSVKLPRKKVAQKGKPQSGR